MEAVMECVTQASDIELWRLLDDAFAQVSLRTHRGKAFLHFAQKKHAQFMAISFTSQAENRQAEPPLKKPVTEPLINKPRMEVETSGMHLHFANLVDEELTDLSALGNVLYAQIEREFIRWSPQCCFPVVNEDVLLYLAILGGKEFPSYYDHWTRKQFSTKWVFSNRQSHSAYGTLSTDSYDYRTVENRAAHALFCSSRRNGDQGIPFDDFVACLLGDFKTSRGRRWKSSAEIPALLRVIYWMAMMAQWPYNCRPRTFLSWLHLMPSGRHLSSTPTTTAATSAI